MSDHVIELSPAYTWPQLRDGSRIPVERAHAPVCWDQLLESVNTILTVFGTDSALGDAIDAGARLLTVLANSRQRSGRSRRRPPCSPGTPRT